MTTASSWGRVLTAMVTPFTDGGDLDTSRILPLVDHLLDHGSDGLVVCGTTGEAPTLSIEEKRTVFSAVVRAVGGRAPIIAGAGTNDTKDAIELSQIALDAGADGLLLVTPYYNKPSQDGLYRHFRTIAEAVDLPIMLYNVPGRTAVNLEAVTCLRLAADVPNIIAVKEAGGNMMQITDLVAGAPEGFLVYSGEDGLVLPMLALGCHGVVSVTAHLVGDQMQQMIQAFLNGDTRTAARLHATMLPVVRACFQSTTPSPAPLKAALNMLGLPAGPPRLPLVAATEAEQAVIRTAMAQAGMPLPA